MSDDELMLSTFGAREDCWEPLDSMEIKLVNHEGNQPTIFIGSTGAEDPILWPPDMKKWLIGKDPDAWKDWLQEEKKVIAMIWLNGITDSMDISLSKSMGSQE